MKSKPEKKPPTPSKLTHQELGQKLDLFSFHDIAPGAPFWHAKGMLIFRELEKCARKLNDENGYEEISTPILVKRELFEKSPAFSAFLAEHGDELCAIRLVPRDKSLPKLRKRGLSIKECYETWALKQSINPKLYTAEIPPHSGVLLWSTIFVVKKDVVFGEIVSGLHSQLTHGDTKTEPFQFRYDFSKWQWSRNDPDVKKIVKKMVALLMVPTQSTRAKLKKKLNSQFTHQHLMGYFETTVWPDGTIYYTDYNRVLSAYIPTPPAITKKSSTLLSGTPAYPGVVQARATKVDERTLSKIAFEMGTILVCDNTDVRYLPLMKKAGAIVTERGGVLSHAAIIARELKKPCVVGVKNLLKKIKQGDLIQVDANKGTVTVLSKSLSR